MSSFIKKIIKNNITLFEILAAPFIYLSSYCLLLIRRFGIQKLPLCRKIFLKLGVFPIRDHYYEPLFDPKHLNCSLRADRKLPGIDFNVEEQLRVLASFDYSQELLEFPLTKNDKLEYYYDNGSFKAGDSEYLYNLIRAYKPGKIIEIGSGFSTLMAINAIKQNQLEDHDYNCEHICIEPYEKPWLEDTGVRLIRKKVEDLDLQLFKELSANDILFIDSSHIIRPQGDVLFEYLTVLPILNSGVLIHIHDIFTPKDYLDQWFHENVFFWNEQYLLEAFLSHNNQFKIIGALNFLRHHHHQEFADKCPVMKNEPNSEPGSFWMVKL